MLSPSGTDKDRASTCTAPINTAIIIMYIFVFSIYKKTADEQNARLMQVQMY